MSEQRSNIIPDAALLQHAILLGKTGAGKSSAMRYLVEHLHAQERPICIIDPKGDWWGIKSAADGKRPGLPYVIFGGEHADVPINEHAGAAVAELVATGNRPSLIDLGGWMVGERTRFFVAFASTLFKLTRGQRYLVIDEVHNFAPQGKVLDVDAGKMLHWANRLASEGRGKGITILAASQRPQKVHKDFITSCETLIAMRVIHKLDRDAIKDWIDGCGDPARGRELLGQLAGMKRGSAWAWSPEIEFGPQLVHFPLFRTYDSFKPQAADAGPLKGWADVDLQEVRSKLQTAIAEAEANDPKALRKRVADLERQLANHPHSLVVDTMAIAQSRADGLQEGYRIGWDASQNAVRMQIGRLKAECAQTLATALDDIWRDELAALNDARPENPDAVVLLPGKAMARPEPLAQARGNGASPVPARVRQIDGRASADSGGAKRRMLSALAQFGTLNARKLAILADVSRGGSTWRGAMAQMRRDGQVGDDGNTFTITASGRAALGAYEPLPTGVRLREHWLSKMGDTRAAIFRAVLEAYPRSTPAEHVARVANVELGGSTWRGHLAHLRGLELVSGSSELSASEDLFA